MEYECGKEFGRRVCKMRVWKTPWKKSVGKEWKEWKKGCEKSVEKEWKRCGKRVQKTSV